MICCVNKITGAVLEELTYSDFSGIDWTVTRTTDGMLLQCNAQKSNIPTDFEIIINAQVRFITNTNLILVENVKFDEFYTWREYIKMAQTPEIWEFITNLLTEQLKQKNKSKKTHIY